MMLLKLQDHLPVGRPFLAKVTIGVGPETIQLPGVVQADYVISHGNPWRENVPLSR
jgi:hypothetical protein